MRMTAFSWNLKFYLIWTLILILTFWSATTVLGHGGKHAGQFTRLQALQKATKMYDQLIDKGKLDSKWETSLENVTIANRKVDGKDEIVVSFERSQGDPKSVFIFFSADGKYAGSNFTGE